MPEVHLKWGGSTATRSLNCPAWPNVAAKAPDMDRTSAAAERGTMLHGIMEKYYTTEEDLGDLCKDLNEDDRDAINYAYNITEDLLERYDCTELVCEEMLQVPGHEIGGSADMIACNEDQVIIIDYKFGYQPVTNVDQFMLYAVAGKVTPSVADMFRDRQIYSAIVQPAVDPANALVHEHTEIELQKFHMDFMRAVKVSEETMTTAGNPGDWCKYCPGAPYCDAKRGRVDQFLNYDPEIATELSQAMTLVGEMKEQIKAVEGEVFKALEHGIPVSGWKLVAKRATRYWKDAEAAWRKLRYSKATNKDMYVEESLRSPAQVEKRLKKAGVQVDGFDELIDNKSTGNTIAPESDKRPAIEVGVVPPVLDAILRR